MLRSVLNTVLNCILPNTCLGCGRGSVILCQTCLNRWPASEPVKQKSTWALFDYNHEQVKKTLWLLKFRGVKILAPILAQAIFERVSEGLAEINALRNERDHPWLIIPIPISPKRRRQRGFNQSAEIAKHLAICDPENFLLAPKILIKTRETKSQTEIKDRRTRLENVRGAFGLRTGGQEKIRGTKILLLDDVITTGGTISEARRVLRENGAKIVIAVAVAHG